MQLHAGGHCGIEGMLVQPPGLYHKAAYAVPVYRVLKLLFGHREACLCRRCDTIRGPWNKVIDEADGKNRKRLPGKEKRINMLLSLEPLIYFESITNGKKILRVKILLQAAFV